MTTISRTPKFYKKNGELTSYALACGYIQRNSRSTLPTGDVELYMRHGVYFVTRSVMQNGTRVETFYKGFPRGREAWSAYREQCRKEVHNG